MRLLNHLRLCTSSKQKWVVSTMSTGGLKLSDVVQFLTSFGPLSLAESWDNVGLLVEPSTQTSIKKVFLTIDLTEAVLREALSAKCNMIIAYHPPIFQPLKRITSEKWKVTLCVLICNIY